jgi:F0F1-type ATP synthase membrane subunit c/vacuolar-type H+-ATPase subunit K
MKDFFQQLNLLFLILLSGQVFFCLVVILLNSGPEYVAQQRDSELFDTLLPIFILSMTFAVHLIDKQRLKRGVLLNSNSLFGNRL